MSDVTDPVHHAGLRLYDAATDMTGELGHTDKCPTHGPTALLAKAYLIACRLDGLTETEAVAKIHWMTAQARRADPNARKN
jgi:hypothetical protein